MSNGVWGGDEIRPLSALLRSKEVTAKITCNVESGDSSTVLFSDAEDGKEFWTRSDSNGILEIALEGCKICPVAYAFAHGSPSTYSSSYFMRNWDFDGWNGKEWITLRSHRNDQTVQTAKVLYKWDISPDVTSRQEFSRFRFACRSGTYLMFVKSLEILQ